MSSSSVGPGAQFIHSRIPARSQRRIGNIPPSPILPPKKGASCLQVLDRMEEQVSSLGLRMNSIPS